MSGRQNSLSSKVWIRVNWMRISSFTSGSCSSGASLIRSTGSTKRWPCWKRICRRARQNVRCRHVTEQPFRSVGAARGIGASASRATENVKKRRGNGSRLLHFIFFFCGRPRASVGQKKGCSKAALWDLQCYQRLKTYIVTSKPKRISVYSGLVHMVRLLQRVNPLHRGSRPLPHDLGTYSVAAPLPDPTRKH